MEALDDIDRQDTVPFSQVAEMTARGLTPVEIGVLLGRSASTIRDRLLRHGYTPATTKATGKYNQGLAVQRQAELLESMTPDKMKATSIKDASVAFGILRDKAVDTSSSPNNISVIVETLHARDAAASRVKVQVGSGEVQVEGQGGSGGIPPPCGEEG